MKKALVVLPLFILSACGGSTPASSSPTAQTTRQNRQIPGQGAWSLSPSSLVSPSDGSYARNVSLSTKSGTGKEVNFQGDYLRNYGFVDSIGTTYSCIELKPYDEADGSYGYLYQTSGELSYLTVIVLRDLERPDSESLPSLYFAPSIGKEGGQIAQLSPYSSISSYQLSCVYGALPTRGAYFRIENKSDHPIYIVSIANPS